MGISFRLFGALVPSGTLRERYPMVSCPSLYY